MKKRFVYETKVLSCKMEEPPIKRGWKNQQGQADFEYHKPEYIVVTERFKHQGFRVGYDDPGFRAGQNIKITLES